MIALCRTHKIVTIDWLHKSAEAGKPIDHDEDLAIDRKLASQIKSNVSSSKHVLDPFTNVYFVPGVAGKQAPPREELKLIVEAAGSHLSNSLPSGDRDLSAWLVITGKTETGTKKQKSAVALAVKNGATKHKIAWLLETMMKQSLE